MKRWWIAAAVAALWLGWAGGTRAQSGPGAGPIPEPAPDSSCPTLIPGPLPNTLAPPGPDNGLGLSPTVPTAWERGPLPESAAYFNAGGLIMKRSNASSGPLIFRDTGAVQAQGSGFVPAPAQRTVAVDAKDLSSGTFTGMQFTAGYFVDNNGFELTFSYLFDQTSTADVNAPGQIFVPFTNPPAGFAGNNGLWLQADRAQVSLQHKQFSAEGNYRWWERAQTGAEGIFGIRYFQYQERLDLTTNHSQSIAAGADPALQTADYFVGVTNHYVGGQIGFEYNLPICSWLMFASVAKGSVGANFVDGQIKLTRGDGLQTQLGVGNRTLDTHAVFAYLFEVGTFLDIVNFDRIRLRVGYEAIWALNMAEASKQVNFDLSATPTANTSGNVLFHGAVIEFQFLF